MPRSLRRMWTPLRWPAPAVESAPKAVRAAWTQCVKATDAATSAGQVHQAALTALANADRDDQTAANAAVREGKPIPARTKDQRREAVADAHRIRQAHEDAAMDAERRLIDAANQHRAEWLEALGPDVDTAVDTAAAAIDAAEQALDALAGLSAVWRWLDAGRLDAAPSVVLPDDARQALRTARDALADLTPAGIKAARAAKARDEQEAAAQAPAQYAGVVLDPAGRRALAG